MGDRRRPVRLELTQTEAAALLSSNTHTEAGEMREIFLTGREISAFERADRKLREAIRSTQRDSAISTDGDVRG